MKVQEELLKGSLRVDIFGIKEGGSIDNPLTAPLRPKTPALKKGGRYLIEVVLRTLKLGHPFTQGTVDSNEVWVDATARRAGKVVAQSVGRRAPKTGDTMLHLVYVHLP